MPDNDQPPPENQVDWHAMLHDLEKSIEVMSDSLDAVRIAMRRMVMVEPWLTQAGAITLDIPPTFVLDEPLTASDLLEPVTDLVVLTPEPSHERIEEPASVAEEEPAAVEEAPLVEETEVPAATGELLAHIDIEDSEAAREAVRQAFDKVRAEMSDEPSFIYTPIEPTYEASEEEAAMREAVRREVEAARAELAAPPAVAAAEPEPEEVAPVQAGPAAEPVASHQDDAAADEDGARESVRRDVEAAPAEFAQEPAAAVEEAPQDDAAMREAVRREVEAARAGLLDYAGVPQSVERSADAEEESREAVRRAVEEARAEMRAAAEPVKKPFFAPPARPVREVAPTLTIEDPESRVELARVYNLLKALDLAGSASLLNYTSRQVSVALAFGTEPPAPERIAAAVSETFGRQCETVIAGINVIVKLGAEQEMAA